MYVGCSGFILMATFLYPVEVLTFSGFYTQLNCVCNCDDHSSLDFSDNFHNSHFFTEIHFKLLVG